MPGEQAFLLAGIFVLLTAAGWSIRYIWEKDKPKDANQYLNVEYLKGLNFLLNEQTDQAVDLFLRMVRVDDETIETHFTLGSLFRRRGEVDRAIRIHQNIMARPNLPDSQRSQALCALAKDYRKAGLLDRAEKLFQELLEDPDYRQEGLEALVQIYEQERDWLKAIDVGRELERAGGAGRDIAVSHYYCEQAQKCIDNSDLAGARDHLKSAQAGRSRTTRGGLIRAGLAERVNDEGLARKLYWSVVNENPDLIVEVLPRLFALYPDEKGKGQLGKELTALLKRNPEVSNVLAYSSVLYPELESPLLDDCVRRYIENEPTLTEFVAAGAFDEHASDASYARVKLGLSKLAQKTARYRCKDCGFSSMGLIWQCPSCKAWESQRPAHEVKFDTLVRGDTVDW